MTAHKLPLSTLVEACAEASPLLGLPSAANRDLLNLIDDLRDRDADPDSVLAALRRTRYLLMECSDSPVAALLADRIGRHLDDGVGGVFF